MSSHLGAIGAGIKFSGFSDSDFDAYEKKKWTSNAYTLARRNAKDKLLALFRAAQGDLQEEIGVMELGASEEAPSVANGRKVQAQWVFLTRPSQERARLKPHLQKTDLQSGASLFDIAIQHQHACLVTRLEYEGLAVGVELATKATVDRDNAAEKLKDELNATKFLARCKELPGNATAGFGETTTRVLDLTVEQLMAWFEQFRAHEETFRIEVFFERNEELLQSENLIGTIADQMGTFLEIYRGLAWAPENDYTEVEKVVQEAVTRQEKESVLEPGARVVMLAGLFAGRAGYIAEIDAKGKAKVMVGPVNVTVDAKDLKPA